MLTVIFGAGASFDSVPEDEGRLDEFRNWRPPLAQELFDQRFGQVIQSYPDAHGLIASLRDAVGAGRPIEAELRQFRDEAGEDPNSHRALAGLRFYLRDIIWRCSDTWLHASAGVTNYQRLLFRLHGWARREEESICYITFNYDLLLEAALRTAVNVPFASMQDYVAWDAVKLIKPHGSVNWARPVSNMSFHKSTPKDLEDKLIEHAIDVQPDPDWYIIAQDVTRISMYPKNHDRPLIPAIAIPVDKKAEFECPPGHLESLTDSLSRTSRLLIIGWRGMEEEFLSLMATALSGRAMGRLIVTGSNSDTRQVRGRLESAGIQCRQDVSADSLNEEERGFSQFAVDGQVDRLLAVR